MPDEIFTRSVCDILLFLGNLRENKSEVSEKQLIRQVWVVVYDDYSGNITPDGWESEFDDTIVGIYSNKNDAEEKVKDQNCFDNDMHEGYSENGPGTKAYFVGPFSEGMYKVGDKYV